MTGPPDGYPDAAEFGLLRAWLAQNGFSQQWIDSIIGSNPSAHTRGEITELLKAALKELPKAED